MSWTMNVNPLGNLALSALVALVPILFLFIALTVLKMKGHWAAIIATSLAVGVACIAYGMPMQYAGLSVVYGALFGLFPVSWIVITALFIYNMSVKTGQFEVVKNSLATISDDRRMQALLIAFSFGAFIEGAAGFGTPVAITAAMLAGLGFNPLYAASLCLLANTAPVAFGAIGIPIVVGANASGVDLMGFSQMVGRTLPFLSVFVPLYLVILMAGWKKGIEVWPACMVSGGSFALVQFLSANYIGPLLPDILSSISSMICTVIFLRYWHPKESWRFPEETKSEGREKLMYSGGQVFRSWAPFLLLSVFVAAWGINNVQTAMNQIFLVKLPIEGLDKMVIDDVGKSKAAVYTFNGLSAAGTAILLAWFFCIPVMGASIRTALDVAGNTLKQLRWPIVTIATILGFAYIMNYSGMAITLGHAFASTGWFFPFFAAFLGWLGVFMTGSDTSTNALFGKLQAVTAHQLGINPLVTVNANTCGGVTGKMISPQSISVATAATNMVGKEYEIFRFTLKHSLILCTVVGIICMLQAYVFPWIVPAGEKVVPAVAKPVEAAPMTGIDSQGLLYVGIAFAAAFLITVMSRILGKGLVTKEGADKAVFH
jgi:lactate permease